MNSKENKKVLVTGGSGFLGSHVADALSNKGYDVVLFDLTPSKFKKDNQQEYLGDILNIKDVKKAVKGCRFVFHFAAQADIDQSDTNPSETIKINILGTQNLLEVSLSESIERFIFSSTIYVYSDLGSFYRVSKQACEKIIEEYNRSQGLEYTILRFGSLYGPRANKFNGIKKYLLEALNFKKIIRRGDGEEIREYIHVEDASRLSTHILSDNYINKHIIITGQQKIKVKELLFMINEILGGDINIEFGNEEHLNHYKITPYNFKPQIGIKITPKTYYDFGQGLMDQIYDLKEDLESGKENGEISLRKRKNEIS